MIAVDTSALMAILLGEAEAEGCKAALEREPELLISAGTVAEALIVAARRNVAEEMGRLIDGLGFDIVPVTGAAARRIAAAYRQWGRGAHPAGLNSATVLPTHSQRRTPAHCSSSATIFQRPTPRAHCKPPPSAARRPPRPDRPRAP
jgi:ribonuclease VapC